MAKFPPEAEPRRQPPAPAPRDAGDPPSRPSVTAVPRDPSFGDLRAAWAAGPGEVGHGRLGVARAPFATGHAGSSADRAAAGPGGAA